MTVMTQGPHFSPVPQSVPFPDAGQTDSSIQRLSEQLPPQGMSSTAEHCPANYSPLCYYCLTEVGASEAEPVKSVDGGVPNPQTSSQRQPGVATAADPPTSPENGHYYVIACGHVTGVYNSWYVVSMLWVDEI